MADVGPRSEKDKGTAERHARGVLTLDPKRCKCGREFQPVSASQVYCQDPDCETPNKHQADLAAERRRLAQVERRLDRTLAQLKGEVLGHERRPSRERIETRLRALADFDQDQDLDWVRGALLQVAADCVQWAAAIDAGNVPVAYRDQAA